MENIALATLLLPFLGALWIAFAPQRLAKGLCTLFALLATLGMALLAWRYLDGGKTTRSSPFIVTVRPTCSVSCSTASAC